MPELARAETLPLVPVPRVDQVVPFHLAMLLALTVPDFLNVPPANSSPPMTAIALTLPS